MSDPSSAPAAHATAAPYGSAASAIAPKRKKVTVTRLAQMRAEGEKIAMLTAYDATFAAVADAAGVDCLLVGDSLGMVSQGRTSTAGVTLQDMVYHTECVARGLERHDSSALLIADLPYGSYHQSREQAMQSSVALMQAGAQMIKLEGGGWTVDVVAFLVARGIPICAHLGLTPQTVAALGGYKVQGREPESARKMMMDAMALESAGASLLVLEMVPAALAASITQDLKTCATIGIGAGNGTAGQVLVMHDMLGVNLGRMARFVRNFAQDTDSIQGAFSAYAVAVKDGSFPNNEQHAW